MRIAAKSPLAVEVQRQCTSQKLEEIAANGSAGSGVSVSALIGSAVAAKRIQNTMKLGTAYLDVDFAVPPRVN